MTIITGILFTHNRAIMRIVSNTLMTLWCHLRWSTWPGFSKFSLVFPPRVIAVSSPSHKRIYPIASRLSAKYDRGRDHRPRQLAGFLAAWPFYWTTITTGRLLIVKSNVLVLRRAGQCRVWLLQRWDGNEKCLMALWLTEEYFKSVKVCLERKVHKLYTEWGKTTSHFVWHKNNFTIWA